MPVGLDDKDASRNETVDAASQAEDAAGPVRLGAGVRLALGIIATVTVLGALDYAQNLMLPVLLAFILSLTLTPLNLWLQRRLWPSVSALVLVGGLVALLGVGAGTLFRPLAAVIDDAPRIGIELRARLAEVREPVEAVSRASEQVEELTETGEDDAVEEVVVREPGLLNRAATNVGTLASTLVVTITLTYFLLATNRLIYEKIVHAAPRLSDKKRALTAVNDVVTVVSRYLLTITIINAGLGTAIGLTFWAIGMPSPAIWGFAAFLLNYLPYVGALIGTVSAGLVGILHLTPIEYAAVPALAYLALTSFEGQFVTPTVLGRRLELNPVVILLSIAMWGFLWGIPGVIVAVPVLVVVKAVSDRVPALQPLSDVLSGTVEREPVPGREDRE